MPHVQIAGKTLATCPPTHQGGCHNFGVPALVYRQVQVPVLPVPDGGTGTTGTTTGTFGTTYPITGSTGTDFGHKSTQKPWAMPQLWYFTLATSPRICGTINKITVLKQKQSTLGCIESA